MQRGGGSYAAECHEHNRRGGSESRIRDGSDKLAGKKSWGGAKGPEEEVNGRGKKGAVGVTCGAHRERKKSNHQRQKGESRRKKKRDFFKGIAWIMQRGGRRKPQRTNKKRGEILLIPSVWQ